ADLGLRKYIKITPTVIPNTFGKKASKRFGKEESHLVERLANKIMVSGHLKDSRIHKRISGRDTGKKQTTYRLIKAALEIVERKTNQNPIQVLIKAVENAAPREETTRIRQGGIIVHRAVDVAPARRLDIALSLISHGAGQRAFNKKQSFSAALAEELMSAMKYETKTYSIAKREELERVAQSAR
ncbi:MAG: 30S ribosomal protein S7, partial [archaeon]